MQMSTRECCEDNRETAGDLDHLSSFDHGGKLVRSVIRLAQNPDAEIKLLLPVLRAMHICVIQRI